MDSSQFTEYFLQRKREVRGSQQPEGALRIKEELEDQPREAH